MSLDRRTLLLAALTNAVAGGGNSAERSGSLEAGFDPEAIYRGITDGGVAIPPVNYGKLPSRLLRRRVEDSSGAPAGSISVRVAEHYLYFSNGDGTAIRYGIGVGREGYLWRGLGVVGRVAAWPRWVPTLEMRQRLPELDQYAKGVAGGIGNPLGARALYIYENGRDTLYRIHGTPEWWSVGRSMSSGCVRMLNQDVIDLSLRARVGAKIVIS